MRPSFHRRVQLELWGRQHALLPQFAPPDDWPSEARLDAAGLRPLWHGDHSSGFSATFAAVNGLRLLMAVHRQLSDKEEQRLIADAWRWQLARHDVVPDRGLRQSEWLRMVEALCQGFHHRNGAFVRVVQPWRERRPDKREFLTTIERLIVGQHVVLGLVSGAHYLVIRGYTPTSLLLFDSGARAWMMRQSISLVGSARSCRHRFAAASTLALSRTF